jgi:polar amino acid transport system substrate-binding protein
MRPAVLFFFFALAGGANGANAAETVLRIASAEDEVARRSTPMLARAYARLGLKLAVEPMPLKRGRQQLLRGEVDGELMRADLYFEATPEAVKVPQPLVTSYFWLLQHAPCPAALPDAAELERGQVLHLRGVLLLEQVLPEATRLAVTREGDIYPMLRAGRARYAIVTSTDGVAPESAAQQGLCRFDKPWMARSLYHALHRRHAHRVPALAQAIRAEAR